MSRQGFILVETGRVTPRVVTVLRIAEALSMDPAILLEGRVQIDKCRASNTLEVVLLDAFRAAPAPMRLDILRRVRADAIKAIEARHHD